MSELGHTPPFLKYSQKGGRGKTVGHPQKRTSQIVKIYTCHFFGKTRPRGPEPQTRQKRTGKGLRKSKKGEKRVKKIQAIKDG